MTRLTALYGTRALPHRPIRVGEGKGEEPCVINTMLPCHGTQLGLQLEVIKKPHGTERYCDEKCLHELLLKDWKGSNILVSGLPGIGKTSLWDRLARELETHELKVYKFENIDELEKNEGRHFNNHENRELIILVDNVTTSQLYEFPITHSSNTTAILFSRTLLVDKFDCLLKIKGTFLPSWDIHSLWDDHIKMLCSIPFLYVSFETLSSNCVPGHDMYFLLLAIYLNYCQTLRVSLFTSGREVPVKIEKLLKNLADFAYCQRNHDFIEQNQLRKFCNVGDEMGVVAQGADGEWKFTFEGLVDCLTAFKLFWINEEQFNKDTENFDKIKVPIAAMNLFKGVHFYYDVIKLFFFWLCGQFNTSLTYVDLAILTSALFVYICIAFDIFTFCYKIVFTLCVYVVW